MELSGELRPVRLTAPLAKKAEKALREAIELGYVQLKMSREAPGREVCASIDEKLTDGSTQSMPTATMLGAVCGSLFGDAACRGLGWRWATVEEPDGTAVGIVSPGDVYAFFPQPHFFMIAAHHRGSNASQLYDLFESGDFPPRIPGKCGVLPSRI